MPDIEIQYSLAHAKVRFASDRTFSARHAVATSKSSAQRMQNHVEENSLCRIGGLDTAHLLCLQLCTESRSHTVHQPIGLLRWNYIVLQPMNIEDASINRRSFFN